MIKIGPFIQGLVSAGHQVTRIDNVITFSHCVPAGGVPRKGLDAYELRRIQQLVMRQSWLAGRAGGPRLRTRGGRVEGRRPLRETLVPTLRQQGSPPEEIAGTVRSCRPRTEGSWSRFRGGGVLGGPGQGLEGNKDFHRPRLASPTLPRPDFLPLLRMKACTANR